MKRLKLNNSSRRGATIIMMMLLLVIVFIFVAFAIDVGRIQLAQLKLQTAADFAARGGAEAMSRGVGDSQDLASFEAAIRDEADMLVRENSLFGFPVVFDSNAQIVFGSADSVAGSGAPSLGRTRAEQNRRRGGPNAGVSPFHGNGRTKFKFESAENNSGALTLESNSIRVNPDVGQFPLVFGSFLGQDSVALRARSSATVQDRDIVVIIDRSTSMLNHDAGTINLADFNSNLFAVEDTLYGPNDVFHTSGAESSDVRHSEFEIDGVVVTLSRMQALKLALLKFRETIDKTPSREQLGLVTYSSIASRPGDVVVATPNSPVDIIGGLSAAEFSAIVDNETTEMVPNSGNIPSHEHTASGLEGHTNDYRDFDFNYLRTRWSGRTNIADGITAGAEVLFDDQRRDFAVPILIVMTDGRHNQESTPEEAATTAMAAHPNMMIYTITFGDGAEQDPMISVANTGNGMHFHAEDASDLIEAFEELGANAGVTVID